MQMRFSFGAWGRCEDKELFLPEKIRHFCSIQGPPASVLPSQTWQPGELRPGGSRGLIQPALRDQSQCRHYKGSPAPCPHARRGHRSDHHAHSLPEPLLLLIVTVCAMRRRRGRKLHRHQL